MTVLFTKIENCIVAFCFYAKRQTLNKKLKLTCIIKALEYFIIELYNAPLLNTISEIHIPPITYNGKVLSSKIVSNYITRL